MSSEETKTKNRQKDKFAAMQLLSRLSTQVRRRVLSRGKTVKSQIEEGIYSLKSAFQKQTKTSEIQSGTKKLHFFLQVKGGPGVCLVN